MAGEVENMFYVGETPWHGLGIKLDKPPTVQEAICAGGLDWKVACIPSSVRLPGVTLDTESGDIIRNSDYEILGSLGEKFSRDDSLILDAQGVPVAHIGEDLNIPTDNKAVVRMSDHTTLGNVGAGYTPVQNADLFSFFNPAVEGGFVDLETAGSLRDGKRVWMLARIKDCEAEIVPGDPVQAFFMLSGSHDGTLPIQIGRTDTRVVCQNTLSLAHKNGKGSLLRVRHTRNVHETIEKISEIIDWQRAQFVASIEQMRTLTRMGVDEATLLQYVTTVFEPEVSKRAGKSPEKSYEKLLTHIQPLFENGRGNTLPGVRGTMWAAYNAITEYQTWHRGRTNDARLDSLWFGENAKTNKRAYTVALEMAQAA